MTSPLSRIFNVTPQQLQQLRPAPGLALPELEAARNALPALKQAPQTQRVLQQTEQLIAGIESIPQTSYTTYRLFRASGERKRYEAAYFLKRARLSAAALRLFLGQTDLHEVVQDYLWSICEESNWVLPAHEGYPIDLFAAETGYLLAETLLLLGATLTEEVRHRVRAEIEHRIFEPYLKLFHVHHWYKGTSNWNGVCNSSVAATFLLLEPEQARVQRALEIALDGLRTFVETAFAEDGSSSEGVAYWHYGLFNFVTLSELLHACSQGEIDLLAGDKMKLIAAFPAKLQLSGSSFASFSDCDEHVSFHPGILTRLAQRTGEPTIDNLLAQPAEPDSDWRLPMMLRDILWWNGSQPASIPPTDARLPLGGTARLVAQTHQGTPIVLSIKAGHNDEEHNHNDIGSFLLHVAGDNLLTDPGRGLYTRDYFGPARYENIFANSYGHSVPRIDGQLQGTGRAFTGTLLEIEPTSDIDGGKQVALEFASAYPSPELSSARRELRLATQGADAGTAWLRDHFQFTQGIHQVEEAFITWQECEIDGASALIHGQHYDLLLTIEQPQGQRFRLERLEEQSTANQREQTLKRLSFILPEGSATDVTMRMTLRKSKQASSF
jgi:hypothetical protein